MILIIAEKPQLGKAIADALPGTINSNKDQTICKGDYTVIWCFGHLLTLKDPEDYDEKYKKWDINMLPFYFPKWENKIGTDSARKNGQLSKAKRVKQIGALLKQADMVINAGDTDEEGQLLIDELLRWFQYKGPVKRLDTADTSKAALQRKLHEMKDNKEFEADGWSAYARGVADKLLGCNMTRYYSILNRGSGVLSIGRVQTPTLGLVVNRDEEIKQHKKAVYYTLSILLDINGIKIKGTFCPDPENPELSEGRFLSNQYLKEKIDTLPNIFYNASITKKKIIENPPLPFNLTELNTYCGKKYGYKPDQVMKITQSLRENHKAITYNRSDCQYLSEEHFKQAPEVLRKTADNLSLPIEYDTSIRSRCFNDEKITAHFAIIPTAESVHIEKMTAEEKNVYQSIAHYYIAQFLPPAVKERTELAIPLENGEKITAFSTTIQQKGFLELLNIQQKKTEDSAEGLEALRIGDYTAILKDCIINEKETKPPAHYTQASLFKDMTQISKYVTNPEVKKLLLLKDAGKEGEKGSIGTSATRAMIINGLIKHGFLEEKKKGKKDILVSTDLGRKFYHMLPDEIKTADITAKWWIIQEDIKKGTATPETLAENVLDTIQNIISSGTGTVKGIAQNEDKTDYGQCPECGSLLQKRKGKYGFFTACSNYPSCRYVQKKQAKIVGSCPECGKDLVERTGKTGNFWGCSNFPVCKYIDWNAGKR
ncbi:MAG: DNA topoisomerase III [Lachnospiraceae bacterium]|jgi:DNA topoisomerase-3|nr:DNA topoisomerase III [Lachnospiraceae bacterium]